MRVYKEQNESKAAVTGGEKEVQIQNENYTMHTAKTPIKQWNAFMTKSDSFWVVFFLMQQ